VERGDEFYVAVAFGAEALPFLPIAGTCHPCECEDPGPHPEPNQKLRTPPSPNSPRSASVPLATRALSPIISQSL
jgi:hypothetical protein